MTKTRTIMLTVLTIGTLMLITAPLQTAYADLVSTSPETVLKATATRTCFATFDVHTVFFHSHGLFGGGGLHFVGGFHWTPGPPVVTNVQSGAVYQLDIRSLQDITIGIAGTNLGGTSFGITYSDTTSQALSVGDNLLTPSSKGEAIIGVTSTVAAQAISSLPPCPPHGPVFDFGHSFPPPPPPITSTVTVVKDLTLTVTQPNAGGPSPRLSQDSGANTLGFSTITQLIDIPRGAASLTVTAPGATTCQVLDQHDNFAGLCGSTIPLGHGDFSGLYTIEATNGLSTATTKISAITDLGPLKLLTPVT